MVKPRRKRSMKTGRSCRRTQWPSHFFFLLTISFLAFICHVTIFVFLLVYHVLCSSIVLLLLEKLSKVQVHFLRRITRPSYLKEAKKNQRWPWSGGGRSTIVSSRGRLIADHFCCCCFRSRFAASSGARSCMYSSYPTTNFPPLSASNDWRNLS